VAADITGKSQWQAGTTEGEGEGEGEGKGKGKGLVSRSPGHSQASKQASEQARTRGGKMATRRESWVVGKWIGQARTRDRF
jgi:hypothetical protein